MQKQNVSENDVREIPIDEKNRSFTLHRLELFQSLKHKHVEHISTYSVQDKSILLVLDHGKKWLNVQKVLEDRKQCMLLDKAKLSILHGVAEALDYMHSQDPPFVHGDIQIGNVLLHSDSLQPMLINARLNPLFRSKQSHAEVSWMPPEMFLPDFRCEPSYDLYGYGLLMYALLTGKIPWSIFASSCPQLIYAVSSGKRPSWSSSCLPTVIKDLVEDCWKQNPAERPTIQMVRQRLQEIQYAFDQDKCSSKPQPISISLPSEEEKKFSIKRLSIVLLNFTKVAKHLSSTNTGSMLTKYSKSIKSTLTRIYPHPGTQNRMDIFFISPCALRKQTILLLYIQTQRLLLPKTFILNCITTG